MATTYKIRHTIWNRLQQLISYLLYLAEGLLALRLVLKLIGANTAAPFTDLVYKVTQAITAPFAAIVRSTGIGTNGGVIEWAAVIAAVVYALAAWALIHLFEIADADTEHVISYSTTDEGYEPDITPIRPAFFDDEVTYNDYRLRHRSPRV